MEIEEKKPEIKVDAKEEEESGTNGTTSQSTSPSQPRKKIFKPEELRQALMPTLEALYRQDPESLPFRQPVDPQLLGIPVSQHCNTPSAAVPCLCSYERSLVSAQHGVNS